MLTYDDLVNDMAGGVKPPEDWKIGIEHEQFIYRLSDGGALPYDGAPGILQILESFRDDYGWDPIVVNGYLIALQKGGVSITLEPGGQFELSGSPQATLHGVRAEANAFYDALDNITKSKGLGVLRAGFHPTWKREDIHAMPKERYGIMRPYMEKKGKYGVDMMLRTCGTQVNLDFSSEADMVKKYRVALGLQPMITALMANSKMAEGVDTGYESYRSLMWTDTDPDRCGVPEFVFEPGMGFARYVDYALDVPMYFIMRNGHHVDVAGKSFRDFMAGKLPGHEGEYPTLDDWHDHLTTLFPEVRLKSYLELRGPDSVEPELVFAMAAFWTGIFYDADALDQAWDLIRDWPIELHRELRMAVPRHGMRTILPERQTFLNLSLEALQIAHSGLGRQAAHATLKSDITLFRDRILAAAIV
jgi:glutamate--cysteine ligase